MSLTRHELGAGILEVDLHVYSETVSLEFFDTCNGDVHQADITLFFDELESLYGLLSATLASIKKPNQIRTITTDQQVLPIEGTE